MDIYIPTHTHIIHTVKFKCLGLAKGTHTSPFLMAILYNILICIHNQKAYLQKALPVLSKTIFVFNDNTFL